MERISNCEFELKGGAYLCDFTTPDHMTTWVNKHNISNEKALWHLCKCGLNISKFQKFPADWNKRIEGAVCGVFPELKAPKAKEIIEEPIENFYQGNDDTAFESRKRGKKFNK